MKGRKDGKPSRTHLIDTNPKRPGVAAACNQSLPYRLVEDPSKVTCVNCRRIYWRMEQARPKNEVRH